MICSKPVRDRRRECKSRMSAIYIHLNRVREANYTLPDIEDGALLVRSRIQRTKKEIPDYILSKYQIGQRLSDACREIGRLGDRLGYLYEIINVCMEQYADTEIENKRNADAFL